MLKRLSIVALLISAQALFAAPKQTVTGAQAAAIIEALQLAHIEGDRTYNLATTRYYLQRLDCQINNTGRILNPDSDAFLLEQGSSYSCEAPLLANGVVAKALIKAMQNAGFTPNAGFKDDRLRSIEWYRLDLLECKIFRKSQDPQSRFQCNVY